MSANPITLGAGLKAAGVLVTTVSDVAERLDRLESLRNTVKSIPLLRTSLRDLDTVLHQVQKIYERALNSIGADKEAVRRLNRQIENCRRPCTEINDILISILTVRTMNGKMLKLSNN
jgi:hypothetical protein